MDALAKILSSIGEGPHGHVVLVGGLVPTLMSERCNPMPPKAHIGTTDADFALDFLLATGHTAAYYQGLTEALAAAGLHPEGGTEAPHHPPDSRWKWKGSVDGHAVELDLLAPVMEGKAPGGPQVVANLSEREGLDELVTLAIPHAELAHMDRQVVHVNVHTPQGVMPNVGIPVAGLAPWLVLKRHAFENRGLTKDKDAYDVAWYLLCLGPSAVAAEIHQSALLDNDRHRLVLEEALRWWSTQFETPDLYAPGVYASYVASEGGPDEPTARRDASEGVKRAVAGTGLVG